MAKIAGRSIEFELALCELFNIDPNKTHKISIVVEAGSITTINVEHHLMENEVGPLIALLGEHKDHFEVETRKTMRSRRPSAVRKYPAKN